MWKYLLASVSIFTDRFLHLKFDLWPRPKYSHCFDWRPNRFHSGNLTHLSVSSGRRIPCRHERATQLANSVRVMAVQWKLIAVLFSLLIVIEERDCYGLAKGCGPCWCRSGEYGKVLVDCTRRNLTIIPDGIPLNVTNL